MTLLNSLPPGAPPPGSSGLGRASALATAPPTPDEAAWLTLWRLGLPLDTPGRWPRLQAKQACSARPSADSYTFEERIHRKPAAYLTHEAWLQGVSVYVDERAIVPRSLIADCSLPTAASTTFLGEIHPPVLDLCTGNGSLAVIAALAYPESVDAADISPDALAVAASTSSATACKRASVLVESDGLVRRACRPVAPTT